MPLSMLEAQFHERSPEPESSHVRLDGHAAQSPGRIAGCPGQRLAANRRHRHHSLALVDSEMQGRWGVVASEPTRVGWIV